MTGFGRAEEITGDYKLSIEIKSVNHRYLDLNIKMPRRFFPFEAEIRNIVKKYVCIVRGEITDDVFTIKLPISRDLKNRHKMCVSKERKRSNNKSKENMGKKSGLLNLR